MLSSRSTAQPAMLRQPDEHLARVWRRSPERLTVVRIDLHTHSAASDGTDSPAELVRAAAESGLDVVALTDHDTTAGWEQALDAAPRGLTVVRGMEMSCEGRGEDGSPVPVHLLAYLFDPEDSAFAEERARLLAERTARIRAMAERIAVDYPQFDPDAIMAATGMSRSSSWNWSRVGRSGSFFANADRCRRMLRPQSWDRFSVHSPPHIAQVWSIVTSSPRTF